jgi:quercetin dioxygenase-like cupin family protein
MPTVGETITNPVAGDTAKFLALPAYSAGELVVELTTVPGGQGPPPHIHPRSSESFEVLRGAIALEDAGRKLVLAAGETHVVTAGTPHRFSSYGDEPALTRVRFDKPGRMGEFLETFYELARAGRTDAEGKPTILQIAVTCGALREDIRTVIAPWPLQLAMFAILGPVGRARGLRPFYKTNALQGAPGAGAEQAVAAVPRSQSAR